MARTRPSEGEAPSDIDTLTFEQALAELEGIVKALESGQGALEASVAAYQRGAALRAHCERKLAEAEQQYKMIAPRAKGEGR